LSDRFLLAASFERDEFPETDTRLHQVRPAAEALALDVQLVESRRAARPHVDAQSRFVVARVRRVRGEEAAEVAGVRPRRGDDEDGELLQLPFHPGASQVIVLAVEAHDRGLAELHERRPGRGTVLLQHVPLLPRRIRPQHDLAIDHGREVDVPRARFDPRRIEPQFEAISDGKLRIGPRLRGASLKCEGNEREREEGAERGHIRFPRTAKMA